MGICYVRDGLGCCQESRISDFDFPLSILHFNHHKPGPLIVHRPLTRQIPAFLVGGSNSGEGMYCVVCVFLFFFHFIFLNCIIFCASFLPFFLPCLFYQITQTNHTTILLTTQTDERHACMSTPGLFLPTHHKKKDNRSIDLYFSCLYFSPLPPLPPHFFLAHRSSSSITQ